MDGIIKGVQPDARFMPNVANSMYNSTPPALWMNGFEAMCCICREMKMLRIGKKAKNLPWTKRQYDFVALEIAFTPKSTHET